MECLYTIINIGLNHNKLERKCMNTDHYFAMGKSHKVCQDYAYSGKNSVGNHVAVISDGCSASPDTDFGARFLVRSVVICGAQTKFGIPNYEEALVRGAIWCASQAHKGLLLSPQCLDATMMYLEVIGDKIIVVTAGDGVIFGVTKNGQLDFWNIEYPSGAPFYPSYLLDEDRYDRYLEEFGDTYVLKKNREDLLCENSEHDGMVHLSTFRKENYKFIGVASDGIHTCNMSTEEALKQLTAFKGVKGDFVKRRMRRFLKNCRKNNTYPTDDISMAVVHLGED